MRFLTTFFLMLYYVYRHSANKTYPSYISVGAKSHSIFETVTKSISDSAVFCETETGLWRTRNHRNQLDRCKLAPNSKAEIVHVGVTVKLRLELVIYKQVGEYVPSLQ